CWRRRARRSLRRSLCSRQSWAFAENVTRASRGRGGVREFLEVAAIELISITALHHREGSRDGTLHVFSLRQRTRPPRPAQPRRLLCLRRGQKTTAGRFVQRRRFRPDRRPLRDSPPLTPMTAQPQFGTHGEKYKRDRGATVGSIPTA